MREESKQQSYMKGKQMKNHELQAIKQAVDKREMSVGEANEVLFQHSKRINDSLVTTMRESSLNFRTMLN